MQSYRNLIDPFSALNIADNNDDQVAMQPESLSSFFFNNLETAAARDAPQETSFDLFTVT